MIFRILKISLFTIPVFLLFACGHVEKNEHVEAFIVETFGKSVGPGPGLSEITGYQKVNAITNMQEGKNYLKADIKSIEDFYDTEGNYIKTEIKHTYHTISYVTNVVHGDNLKEEVQKPSTILLPNNKQDSFALINMTEEEKEQVKNHVLSYTEKLKKMKKKKL
ncbi:hypothetical protein ACFVR1_02600 [Psychrobacillus sp. NPDC058041]|uniref:hypothetical protein n=1 Tax=Psychrobacillus sp. NPDC058041 TaxID=3346310 RepID=UPI0036D8D6D3